MASMNEKDYYAILGVEKDASKDEIRRSFQQKARKLHPDVNKAAGAEESFKEVSEAYAVLSDDDKRRRYDAMRSSTSFGGYGPASQSPYGAGGFDGSPFGWGFPFGGYAARRGSRSTSRAYNPKVGADVTVELDLSEQQAKEGCQRGVTYQRYVACETCNGKGSIEHEHAGTCPTCGGSGHIGIDLNSIFGLGVFEMECPECEGSGKVVVDPCPSCGGTGRTLSASEVVVSVPAHSHDGDEVRVKDMGNAGTNGKASGDFVCRVGVASERLSRRQALGFYMLGLALPFIALGALARTLSGMWLFIALVVVGGLINAFRDGVIHPVAWWRRGFASVVNGFSKALIMAVIVVMMQSCSTLGTRGYMGY